MYCTIFAIKESLLGSVFPIKLFKTMLVFFLQKKSIYLNIHETVLNLLGKQSKKQNSLSHPGKY